MLPLAMMFYYSNRMVPNTPTFQVTLFLLIFQIQAFPKDLSSANFVSSLLTIYIKLILSQIHFKIYTVSKMTPEDSI